MGDKVENKPVEKQEDKGFNLSSIALDLLMGAESTVFGIGAGAVMGKAALKAVEAAGKAGETTLKATEPVRDQAHKEAEKHSGVMDVVCPGWRFWEKAINAEVDAVKDHFHNNPTTAGLEMLVPPLLVIDANFRKLLSH